MFFNNHTLEAKREQDRLAKQDFEETIVKLELKKQEAYGLGNDGGEISQIFKIIEQFKSGELSKKEALDNANAIVYPKEAGIDTTGTHPNMGGH